MPGLNLGVASAPAQNMMSTRGPNPGAGIALGGGNKPKLGGLGLGLDLRKAQQLQQEHLIMAEEKKDHARDTAF